MTSMNMPRVTTTLGDLHRATPRLGPCDKRHGGPAVEHADVLAQQVAAARISNVLRQPQPNLIASLPRHPHRAGLPLDIGDAKPRYITGAKSSRVSSRRIARSRRSPRRTPSHLALEPQIFDFELTPGRARFGLPAPHDGIQKVGDRYQIIRRNAAGELRRRLGRQTAKRLGGIFERRALSIVARRRRRRF
jgi:hypothetical protein